MNHGIRVFARPFVVGSIAIWLVNDHVLKAQYASWWTGKLSDIAGLIVFPLILAALIERWSRRPIEWAIGATLFFYGSINVFAFADAWTEAAIGAFIGPVALTLDPTDLLVLPALGGAFWAWTVEPRPTLRRSWGRVVFAAAIATTVATSPAVKQSETISGTVLLTDDMPSIAMPMTFTLDGEGSDDLDALRPEIGVVPYGQVPSLPVIDTIEFTEPGIGVFKLALGEGVTGPVEVRWSLYAETEGTGGLFSGSSPPEPVLTVDASAERLGPTPLVELPLQIPDPANPPGYRLTFDADPDTLLRIVTPRAVSENSLRISSEDATAWLNVDAPVDLRRPARCEQNPSKGCQFDVYIGGTRRWATFDVVVLVLEGDARLRAQGPADLTRHVVSGTTPTYQLRGPAERSLAVNLSYDSIDDSQAAAMTFLELSFSEPETSDDVFVQHPLDELSFADVCCDDVRLVSWHRGNGKSADEDFEEPFDVSLTWEAVVWTLGDLDPNSIELTIE